MNMTNEQKVKSVYPDARATYFYNKFWIFIESINFATFFKNSESEAWADAARIIDNNLKQKI